jgi:Flp pilus assembly pilin Flp
MNKIKTKYNALSKNEKITYISILTIITIVVIGQIYNVGEAIGATFYNLTH